MRDEVVRATSSLTPNDLVVGLIVSLFLVTILLLLPDWIMSRRIRREQRKEERDRTISDLVRMTQVEEFRREEERAQRRRDRETRHAYDEFFTGVPIPTPRGVRGGPRGVNPGKEPEITLEARGGADCALCRESTQAEPCQCGSVFHHECVTELTGGRCPTPGCNLRCRKRS